MDKRITIRITDEQKERIGRLAKVTRLSESEVVRRLIDESL